MDGNGRWAVKHKLPRIAAYQAGVETLHRIVIHICSYGIKFLTVYAFSSENWQRPEEDVNQLMLLFLQAIQAEIDELNENEVRLRFIGDRRHLPGELLVAMEEAEELTAQNTRLYLNVAVGYGGRWDILQACRQLVGQADKDSLDEAQISSALSIADCPDPELLIRSGGEQRISNFLLWQLAYAELYFTDVLWPDFSNDTLDTALLWYIQRQRRFGRTAEQLRH